jgi:hypothetical protein
MIGAVALKAFAAAHTTLYLRDADEAAFTQMAKQLAD